MVQESPKLSAAIFWLLMAEVFDLAAAVALRVVAARLLDTCMALDCATVKPLRPAVCFMDEAVALSSSLEAFFSALLYLSNFFARSSKAFAALAVSTMISFTMRSAIA